MMKNKFVNFAEDCNKYTRGKTAIIGASTGMTGAVSLSAQAASKSGCGLVSVVVPEELNNIFEIKLTEEMSNPLNSENGSFNGLMYVNTEDVPVGATIKLTLPVDNTKGNVSKLKAFCWDSFTSMTPMGISVAFPAK